MKRLIPLSLAALMIFSSCSGGGDTADVQAAAPAEASTEATVPAEGEPSADGTSAAEAPADVKTVYGEVSEVIGNAVVVKEIEMPQRREFNGAGAMPEDMPAGEDGQPDFSQIEMPEGFTPGEGMPEGFTPGEGGGMAREPNYTGEEIEVIIPVGISVTTTTRGDEGMVESEIDLAEISAGDTITVTYKEDGKTVASVNVTQAGSAGGFGGGMRGEGGGMFFFDGGGGGMPPMPGN